MTQFILYSLVVAIVAAVLLFLCAGLCGNGKDEDEDEE